MLSLVNLGQLNVFEMCIIATVVLRLSIRSKYMWVANKCTEICYEVQKLLSRDGVQ